ncbi:unnamed protein product [Blepharisma stoltei]|uniref:UBC core domain-containing protein n=1 Tax=Blepharisma stoltei TaxID=1481888 RepID=A0AAU9IXM3_9CILI|nr:unnamed protein product [Blepharisma stoltei]
MDILYHMCTYPEWNPEKSRILSSNWFVMTKGYSHRELVGGIEGPSNTPYEGGIFYFSIRLGWEYETPEFMFLSQIIHPNIDIDGKLLIKIPYPKGLKGLLDWVVNLLKNPQWKESEHPRNLELYTKDPEAYIVYAKQATMKYAN